MGQGEKPFEVIKEGLKMIIEAASEELKGGVKLGTLKKTGPLQSPENVSSLWAQFEKHVYIGGEKTKLGTIPKKKPVVFQVTVCFASYSRIDEEVLENINTGLHFGDEYRFSLKSKEMQAVSIVNRLLVPGAVVPDSRGKVINKQYTKAFKDE